MSTPCAVNQRIANFCDFAQFHSSIVWSLSISQREEAYEHKRRPTQVKLMHNRRETRFRYDICRLPRNSVDPDFGSLLRVYNERHPQDGDGHLRYFPRLVERDTLSDATIELVRDWVRACTSHTLCEAQVVRPLPKRLISVHSSAKIILTEHDGELGHYLALSYCWGSVDDAFSITRDNFAERTTICIEEVQLLNNFQHAIAFTRRFKYDYIWIDSLRIIQHDQDDWACEASKMAQYYNNAFLTLTVADELTCHIISRTFRNHYTSPPISTKGEDSYCLRWVLPDDYELKLMSPISKRAWTLQEPLILQGSSTSLEINCYGNAGRANGRGTMYTTHFYLTMNSSWDARKLATTLTGKIKIPIGVVDFLTQIITPTSISTSQRKYGTVASRNIRLTSSRILQMNLLPFPVLPKNMPTRR